MLGSPKRPMPKCCRRDERNGDDKRRGRGEHRTAAGRYPQEHREEHGDRHERNPRACRRDEGKCAHQGQHHERQRSFRQLAPRQWLMRKLTQTDDQRRDRDDAQSVRQEPDTPDAQQRGVGVEKVHRDGPTDGRCCGCQDGRGQEAQHAMQIVELEGLTEPTLDQPSRQQSLRRVAKTGGYRAPEVPVAHQIGGNGCEHDANRHRRAHAPAQCDEDAGGDARSRPEHGHALELGEEMKAKPRRQIVGDGDKEPDRPMPQISRVT